MACGCKNKSAEAQQAAQAQKQIEARRSQIREEQAKAKAWVNAQQKTAK